MNNVVKKLRVMLIVESQERLILLQREVTDIGHEVIASVEPESDLNSYIEQYQPDIIIIDIEMPDRDTLEHMRTITNTRPCPVIMYSNDDDSETIRRAIRSGISAYVVNGLKPKRIRPVLDAAIARFEEFQLLRKELAKTKNTLEERKFVEKAKGILMRNREYNEDAAFKAMQKMAMDRNIKLVELAKSIVSAADLLA